MSNMIVVYFPEGCNMKKTGNTNKTEQKGESITVTEPRNEKPVSMQMKTHGMLSSLCFLFVSQRLFY